MSKQHDFCRTLLKVTMDDVRAETTVEQRRDAWAYGPFIGDTYEWHGPGNHYWHGSACCKWYARAQGWQSWLDGKNTSVAEVY